MSLGFRADKACMTNNCFLRFSGLMTFLVKVVRPDNPPFLLKISGMTPLHEVSLLKFSGLTTNCIDHYIHDQAPLNPIDSSGFMSHDILYI